MFDIKTVARHQWPDLRDRADPFSSATGIRPARPVHVGQWQCLGLYRLRLLGHTEIELVHFCVNRCWGWVRGILVLLVDG